MFSRFTVHPLIIPHIFACTKILGEFLTSMTGFASFLDVRETWFVDPVGAEMIVLNIV